jgi:predicted N-acetyltransferase YhbS
MVAIRAERPGDVAAIHGVHTASFPTDLESRLVDLLRGAGRLPVSLVAEVDGAVVGHIAFSPVTAASGAVGVDLAPVVTERDVRRLQGRRLLYRVVLEGRWKPAGATAPATTGPTGRSAENPARRNC